MNRRSYIKSVFALGAATITSYSVFKWFDLHKSLDIKSLVDKQELIAEMAEIIIPANDTPGAKAAGVDRYILKIVQNCMNSVQQNKFLTGLEDINHYTQDKFHKHFIACSQQEKVNTIQYFSDHTGYSNRFVNKVNNKLLGEPFYTKFRNLTIEGYCLSKLGATQGLAYDYIPGIFEACIPIKKNQKSWATK